MESYGSAYFGWTKQKPIEKTFLDLKKQVKRIQTAGYNDAHTVHYLPALLENVVIACMA